MRDRCPWVSFARKLFRAIYHVNNDDVWLSPVKLVIVRPFHLRSDMFRASFQKFATTCASRPQRPNLASDIWDGTWQLYVVIYMPQSLFTLFEFAHVHYRNHNYLVLYRLKGLWKDNEVLLFLTWKSSKNINLQLFHISLSSLFKSDNLWREKVCNAF